MTGKRWIALFLAISVFILCVFAGATWYLDPLLYFGAEGPALTYYTYEEMYSNPGIAAHYPYDAVLVGTSMVENTDVAECNAAFDCHMVRLPYSGGTTYNMKRILDICFSSPNTIGNVFWELDDYQLFGPHDEPRSPLPEYLYDHGKLPLSYLLNLDIFLKYTLPSIQETLAGQHQPAARTGEYFSGTFSREAVLSGYQRPELADEAVSTDDYLQLAQNNLDANILPLIEAHPETHFTFFYVPFSILYWDTQVRNGSFDAIMDGLAYAMEILLQYDNVTIYYYQNQWDIVTDLDNYKDYSHYGKWINSYMVQAMAAGEGRLTLDNYRDVLQNMSEGIHGYDFESLFRNSASNPER